MRWGLAVISLAAILSGCSSSDRLFLLLDGENYVGNLDVEPLRIGAGLMVHVNVVHETSDGGTPDPIDESYDLYDLRIELDGATLENCGDTYDGFCLIADGPRVHFVVETPDGFVKEERDVAFDLSLATFTPNWGRAPVSRIHLETNATNDVYFVAIAGAGEQVAGRVVDLETIGDVTLAENRDVIAGAPGIAQIAVANAPSIAPLEIKIVTEEESLASIARFTANRIFSDDVDGQSRLTAYTIGTAGADIFDGFDAEGYLALRGLQIEAIGGPHVVPQLHPGGGSGCLTNSYCLLRGDLTGADSVESYVELRAGTAVQQFPVRVIRGQY